MGPMLEMGQGVGNGTDVRNGTRGWEWDNGWKWDRVNVRCRWVQNQDWSQRV